MKRISNLFDQLVDVRTIVAAAVRAARGKRDRAPVRSFLARLDSEAATLVQQIGDGSFQFGAYCDFSIRDPKTRVIHAPSFRDRVVHHALIAVAGPVFERGAIPHSYACRKGRGQHAALTVARRWTATSDWFLKIDVRKYYDSINLDLLRKLLARRFRETRLLILWDRLLESYSHSPSHGLPIGALTSQYLGNFFLDPVDHCVLESLRLPRYLRYMDDLLFFGSRSELEAARLRIIDVLGERGLAAKNGGILNRCDLGVPYLGFVIYPNRVRLNRLGRRRLRRRASELERGWLSGRYTERELQSRGEALYAHAQFGDDVAWRRIVGRFSKIWEGQDHEPCAAGRLLEQHGQELSVRVSQQEEAG